MTQEEQEELNEELLDAASDGNSEEVRLLIAQGANVNTVTNIGITPLHLAAENGHTEAVGVLIDKGAGVNAVDKYGKTPLHSAARKGHTETVKELIAKGANVNAVNKNGYTPLHYAARKGHTGIVQELIAQGANVNCKGTYEQSPLHLAARKGHTGIVQELIAEGADVNAVDEDGKTPLYDAQNQGDKFYNIVIDAIAKKINNDTQRAEAFMMATHDRLGTQSPVNSLIPDLIRKITEKAAPKRMTLGDIPEGKHREAVKARLNELQGEHVGSHTAQVATGREGSPSQGRS